LAGFFVMARKESFREIMEMIGQVGSNQYVLKKLIEQAKVTSIEKGWIEWKELNHASSRDLMLAAAMAVEEHFLSGLPDKLQPTMLMGIPSSGTHFGSALEFITGIPHSISTKTDDVDRSDGAYFDETSRELVVPHVTSYDGRVYAHRFRGIKPGEHKVVGLTEAFIATGRMLERYNDALQPLGIQPVVMSVIAMDLSFLRTPQIGYKRLQDKMPIYAVVHVQDIRNGIKATINGNGVY